MCVYVSKSLHVNTERFPIHFIPGNCFTVWIYHDLFNQFPLDRHFKGFQTLTTAKNATINYLDFSHVNICLWDWFLEVRLLGQSVWAFLILIHINKLLSTEDLPVLSPAIHGSFRFPRALPQSALSKLLDFFQFDRQNWYFNMILVWISIITSDCRPFLCLALFVFSLFIFQIYTVSPFFYCIVGLFLIDL